MGSSKYKQQVKILSNTTQKRLITDLLSNMPNCYVCVGVFRRYSFTEVQYCAKVMLTKFAIYRALFLQYFADNYILDTLLG